MKLLMILILSLIPLVAAEETLKFEGMIGGKIDPGLKLLDDAQVYILDQDVVVQTADETNQETVIVEYRDDAPVSGTMGVVWGNSYKTKYRRESVNAVSLAELANSKSVVAIWSDPKVQAVGSEVDCSWGYSDLTINQLKSNLGIDTLGYDGTGIYVMVVDTGVKPSPYLSVESDLTKGKDYSVSQHGTRSAGVISSNDPNYMGIAPAAKIIDCPAVEGGPYTIDECFNWAVNNYMTKGYPQIITNSWGYVEPISPTHIVTRKIKEAADKGIIVVMAATNCGGGCGSYGDCCDGSGKSVSEGCIDKDRFRGVGKSIHGPNQLAEVITVAAYDATNKRREGYSSQGPSYAPGGIYIAQKPDVAGFADFKVLTGSTYAGTSASTPTVAAGIALMLSANKKLTADRVREIIDATSYVPDTCTGDCFNDLGHGLFNYVDAVQQAASGLCGNQICEATEEQTCPSDCSNICGTLNCNDHNTCTEDVCENGACSNTLIYPCCGNGVCEYGEGIWTCEVDCDTYMCHDNCQYATATNEVTPKANAECAAECTMFCGDEICYTDENSDTCKLDCKPQERVSTAVIVTVSIGVILLLLYITLLAVRRKT